MTAWSHTALEAFTTCPRRYKLTRVTKEVVEQQTEHTRHGNEIHKAFELAIKGEQPMPYKFAHWAPVAQRFAVAPGEKLVEFKFAVDRNFAPTAYFSKDAWCRGVIDFGLVNNNHAVVVDWKSGKPRDDPSQLELFAAAMFAHRPQVSRVSTGYAWLTAGRIMNHTYDRQQVPELWSGFLPRVRRLELAVERDDFPPHPSGLCREHCPVTRKHCQFSGRG